MTDKPNAITIVTTDGTYILPRTTDLVQAWPMETPSLAARTIAERVIVEPHTHLGPVVIGAAGVVTIRWATDEEAATVDAYIAEQRRGKV